jgi:signal transduction histidine kinase
MIPPPGTQSQHDASQDSSGCIPQRWLHLWRGVWIGCTLLLLANFLASIPAYYRLMGIVCTLPNQRPCTLPGQVLTPSGQLTPGEVAALAHLHLSVAAYATLLVIFTVAISLLYWSVGLLIFWRKSAERMGLFVSLLFVLNGSTGPTDVLLGTWIPASSSLPLQTLLALLGAAKWAAAMAFVLTFPTGRFGPRWSWLLTLLNFLVDATSEWAPVVLLTAGLLVSFGGTLFILIYRYGHVFDTVQRQQVKWFVYAAAIAIPLAVIGTILPAGIPADSAYQPLLPALPLLASAMIPLGVGIAILRYRLWDIDVLINRTLVYGTLSAGIVGIYILIVGGFGTLLEAQGSPLLSLVAAALVAILFQPLREWLQHAINRLMYGERDDPYRVLARLGQRLEATVAPEAILPTIVETVAQALKLPYAAISLQQEGEQVIAASYGTPQGEELHLPLAYQKEQEGELILAARAPGEAFSPADRRLLEDLARQVDIAAHAVRLTADMKRLTRDLQQARERLVSAREEERRRLRRDLHDGLGPQLSSQMLLLTSAQMLLRQDPDEAEAILKSAMAQAQEAIHDIRRLVYALRPPALDDLGLVAAIAEQLEQNRASGIMFSLCAPQQLAPLPAAVEAACYRIVQEALTNVVRHAHAHTCIVRLACEKQVTIEVLDDGQGLPPAYRCGVGLTSMRERAEELGGRWLIEAGAQGGTRVYAELPYR